MPNLQHQHCGLLLNICWCNSAEDLAFKFYTIHLKIIKLLLCISQKWEPSLGGICINYISIFKNALWASPSIHCSSWTSDWSHWEWSARLLSSSDPASPFCKRNYLSLSAPIKPSALVLPTSEEFRQFSALKLLLTPAISTDKSAVPPLLPQTTLPWLVFKKIPGHCNASLVVMFQQNSKVSEAWQCSFF